MAADARPEIPGGQLVLAELIKAADVVIHNFTADVAQALEVDFGRVAAINPCIIYLTISGFGPAQANRPGFDLVAQATSGLMSVTGNPERSAASSSRCRGNCTSGRPRAAPASSLTCAVAGSGRAVCRQRRPLGIAPRPARARAHPCSGAGGDRSTCHPARSARRQRPPAAASVPHRDLRGGGPRGRGCGPARPSGVAGGSQRTGRHFPNQTPVLLCGHRSQRTSAPPRLAMLIALLSAVPGHAGRHPTRGMGPRNREHNRNREQPRSNHWDKTDIKNDLER
jgi:hypothetical protein